MTNAPIVLVTETEFRRAADVFESTDGVRCVAVPGDESVLARAVVDLGARYVIVGSVRYSSGLYGALPRGGVIARFGVGHDGIDKRQATKAGLLCTNTPGVLDESVAELAVLLMLAASRHFTTLTADMRKGTWALGPAGAELRGKNLAVVGKRPDRSGYGARGIARLRDARHWMPAARDSERRPGRRLRIGDDRVLRRSSRCRLRQPPHQRGRGQPAVS